MHNHFEHSQKDYPTIRDLCKAAELNSHQAWKLVGAGKLTVCLPLHGTLVTPQRPDTDGTDRLDEKAVVSLTGPGYLDNEDIKALRTHGRDSHDIHQLTYADTPYTPVAMDEVTEQGIVYRRCGITISIRDIRIQRDEFDRFVRGMARFLE